MSDARFVEEVDIASLVDAKPNRDVLAYLKKHEPSCHSDTGEQIFRAANKCGDCTIFSPSFASFRYVALITNHRVFALGVGQFSACYRLPTDLRATALETGAVAAPEIGADWVRFELFQPNRPSPDLPFWTLRAYTAAREGS